MLSTVDIADNKWLDFVNSHPESTIFHHPQWSKILAQSYGYRPFVIALQENGNICSGLPIMDVNSWLTGRRYVSLPFTDHCGPLLGHKSDLESFTQEVIQFANVRGTGKFEIRYELPKMDDNIYYNSFYAHHSRLEGGSEGLLRTFRKNTVRCIEKAFKNGVTVSKKNDLQSMMLFYDLHMLTRHNLGVPTQPRKYFIKLWEKLIQTGMGIIMIAFYKEKAIAGGVFLHFKDKLVFKYGASDPRHLKYCGNHAMFWETIQWGCKNGFQVLDWGRTEKRHEGLRHFKLGWGTTEGDLIYSSMGLIPGLDSSDLKHKILGLVVRKSPLWVGRTIGEMLYKHVG